MEELSFDPKDCALARVSRVMQGKWTMTIVYLLGRGTLRFGDIRRRLPGATDANLTKDLRLFERQGMAHREVYPVVPPKVEYSLTEMGRAFLPVLEKINAWEERYAEEQSLPCSRQCLCHSAGGSSLGTMDSTNQYFYGVRMFVSLRAVAARRIWHGADKESNLFGSRDAKDDESEVGNAQKKSQTGKVRAVMPFKTREVSQACRNLLGRAMKRLA